MMRKRTTAPAGGNTMRVDYLPLSTLARAPRNPKAHDLGALGQSYARFGYVSPIVLDEASGRLVAGHGRLDALQQAKASGQRPPTRIKVGPKGEWLVPVVRGVHFRSGAEAESYLVADNRLTMLGGWDEPALAGILADLAAQEALAGTGFDGDDVDALLRQLAGPLLGPELDESLADGVRLCVCGACGHEHHRVDKR